MGGGLDGAEVVVRDNKGDGADRGHTPSGPTVVATDRVGANGVGVGVGCQWRFSAGAIARAVGPYAIRSRTVPNCT